MGTCTSSSKTSTGTQKTNLDYQGKNGGSGKANNSGISADKINLNNINSKALNNPKDAEAIAQLKAAANNPNAKITIYRATIGDNINSGDWVFLSQSMADKWTKTTLGTPKPNVKVIKKVVSAKDVQWQHKNLEFGYFPNKKLKNS